MLFYFSSFKFDSVVIHSEEDQIEIKMPLQVNKLIQWVLLKNRKLTIKMMLVTENNTK